MINNRKRNREADDAEVDPEEDVVNDVVDDVVNDVVNDGVNDAFRKKVVKVICAVIIIFNVFLSIQRRDPILPTFVSLSLIDLSAMFQSDEFDDEVFLPAKRFQQDMWARIVAIDQFCVDPTRKSEQPFWDTYRGREEDWYKESRMSQATFHSIVRDCVPFLYSRPTYSLKSARFRYMRGKVVMATLIRYMAIQSDQHTLG